MEFSTLDINLPCLKRKFYVVPCDVRQEEDLLMTGRCNVSSVQLLEADLVVCLHLTPAFSLLESVFMFDRATLTASLFSSKESVIFSFGLENDISVFNQTWN